MSWWGAKNFSEIASSAASALKSAQKQIDNVLEISETGEAGSSGGAYSRDVGFDPLLTGDDFGWDYYAARKQTTTPSKEDREKTEPIPETAEEGLSKVSREEEDEEDTWTSWSLKGLSTLTSTSVQKRRSQRSSQRKAMGKRKKAETPKGSTLSVETPPTGINSIDTPQESTPSVVSPQVREIDETQVSTPAVEEPLVSLPVETPSVGNICLEGTHLLRKDTAEDRTPSVATPRENAPFVETPEDNTPSVETIDDVSEMPYVYHLGKPSEKKETQSGAEKLCRLSKFEDTTPNTESVSNHSDVIDNSMNADSQLTSQSDLLTEDLWIENVLSQVSPWTEQSKTDEFGFLISVKVESDTVNMAEVGSARALETTEISELVGTEPVLAISPVASITESESSADHRYEVERDVADRTDFIFSSSSEPVFVLDMEVSTGEDSRFRPEAGDVYVEKVESSPEIIEVEEKPHAEELDNVVISDHELGRETVIDNPNDCGWEMNEMCLDDVGDDSNSYHMGSNAGPFSQTVLLEADVSALAPIEEDGESVDVVIEEQLARGEDALQLSSESSAIIDSKETSTEGQKVGEVNEGSPDDRNDQPANIFEPSDLEAEVLDLTVVADLTSSFEPSANQDSALTDEPAPIIMAERSDENESTSQTESSLVVSEPLPRHSLINSRDLSARREQLDVMDEKVDSPGMDTSGRGMWDDTDLQHVQSDLVEVESDSPSSDADMTSSTNDVTLTQDSSSGSDVLNQSRETGAETDNSTETLRDEDETKNNENHSINVDNVMKAENVMEGMETTMDHSTTSSVGSSSFVKCMLDDAMSEPRDDEHLSTSSDKSDLVRIDSGQTSGDERDEIDTTTSSDIEIISTPNGEFRLERQLDLSPLRHAFTSSSVRHVTSQTQTHRRSDSNSSSSGHSKNSDQDQLSPGRETSAEYSLKERREPGHRRVLASPGKDLTRQKQQQHDTEILLKKMAETKEILEVRENKILEMSRDNVELRESNQNLRTQLHQSQEALENDVMDLNAISQEFTARLREAEKKIQVASQERDDYKKRLHSTEEAMAKSFEDSKLRQLMEEKDEQISELLAEGEKLSKHQLVSNNTIKKLRSKEKELEGTNKTQAKKIDEQKMEIEKLINLRNNLETMEEKQGDIITSLTEVVKQLEKENKELLSDNEDQSEQIRSMQAALDSSYKEIHELNKTNATRGSEMQEMLLKARRETEAEIVNSRAMIDSQTRYTTEAMEQQIEDLQYNLTRAEKDHHRIEDILRQEFADLQIRLQEADNRCQDVSQSVSIATRPLLRQVETLQSTLASQASSWEKMEKSLSDQLVDSQQQFMHISEREKFNEQKVTDLQSRVSSLEAALNVLRQEKSRLVAELETERARANILEDTKQRDAAQIDLMKSSFAQEVIELKREKALLSNQLDTEKSKCESEKKKYALANEQLQLEKGRSQIQRSDTPRSNSRSSDVSLPMLPPLTQEEVLEHTLMMTSQNGSRTSLYETLRQNGAANLLDNLQSQLKQKEGELLLLQGEISELEETRESMTQELVLLTTRNQELEEQVSELSEIRTQHQGLSSRYNALLQMYGEKVEEMEELRLDLGDVKDMYKTQIEELLQKR